MYFCTYIHRHPQYIIFAQKCRLYQPFCLIPGLKSTRGTILIWHHGCCVTLVPSVTKSSAVMILTRGIRPCIPWITLSHDDVIKLKHFPCYWPFVRGIHRSPVNSPHKGQWPGALMFPSICALNKRLRKQSWGWWFETPTGSLWRHFNDQHVSFHLNVEKWQKLETYWYDSSTRFSVQRLKVKLPW